MADFKPVVVTSGEIDRLAESPAALVRFQYEGWKINQPHDQGRADVLLGRYTKRHRAMTKAANADQETLEAGEPLGGNEVIVVGTQTGDNQKAERSPSGGTKTTTART